MKKRKGNCMVVIIVIIGLGFLLAYGSSDNKENTSASVTKNIDTSANKPIATNSSIPELAKYIDIQLSPEDYIGKDIRIRGGLTHSSLRGDGKSFVSYIDRKPAFQVHIENLPQNERRMLLEEKLGVSDETILEIIGTVIEERSSNYPFAIRAKSVKIHSTRVL